MTDERHVCQVLPETKQSRGLLQREYVLVLLVVDWRAMAERDAVLAVLVRQRAQPRAVFVGDREFPWRIESDGSRRRAVVPSPCEGYSLEDTENVLGEQRSHDLEALCSRWKDTMPEYLDVARGLRDEVQQRSGYDPSGYFARELRRLEAQLIAIRDAIIEILESERNDELV